MSYQFAGVLSLVAVWLAIFLLIWRKQAGRHVSISEHAITSRRSWLFMALVQTIMLPIYGLYVWKWLAPTYALGSLFNALTVISVVGLILAAWIPQRGKTTVLHEFLAYGASFLFIPMLMLVVLSTRVPAGVRIFAGLSTVYMAVSVALFSLTRWAKRYHLYFQLAYFGLFHIIVVLLTVLKPRG